MSIYEAIATFLDEWDKIRETHYVKRSYKWPLASEWLVLHDNPRWLKIVMEGTYPRVEAFIDRETGDIYKAATWNKAAKHPRGNVFSDKHGVEALDATVFPCVRYLK